MGYIKRYIESDGYSDVRTTIAAKLFSPKSILHSSASDVAGVAFTMMNLQSKHDGVWSTFLPLKYKL
jgi:hypothetical protein